MFKTIRWPVKTVLVLTGILSLVGCSSGYKEKNGKTTFNGKEINDKNFIVLSDAFAKDSTTAYYKEQPLQNVDVASFEALDIHYAKDKSKVYYCDEYREGQNYYLTKRQTILEIEKALPATFVSLDNGYAKDHLNAYFEGKRCPVKDVATFTSINAHFAKDSFQAYLNCQPVAGSDGKTFELMGDNFAKDRAHIYYYAYIGNGQHNICIVPCDKPSFQILDYRYSKDKTAVFFLGFTIAGADPKTFLISSSGYAKDQAAVYFGSKRINGANAATFEVYKENDSVGHDVVFAKDHSSVYMDDKKLGSADVLSFKVLGENYGSDRAHVFYKALIVKGADPNTFKVYPHAIGDADAEDIANRYHEGKKVNRN